MLSLRDVRLIMENVLAIMKEKTNIVHVVITEKRMNVIVGYMSNWRVNLRGLRDCLLSRLYQ